MLKSLMDKAKLKTHIKLCFRNLKSERIKCCANCPFEEEITKYYPEVAVLFRLKRRYLESKEDK